MNSAEDGKRLCMRFWENSTTTNSSGSSRHLLARRIPFGTQVAFVHIFKTGGSSIRALFRSYRDRCEYSLAILHQCNKEKLRQNIDNRQIPCRIKELYSPTGEFISIHLMTPQAVKESLRSVTLAAGHFRYGFFEVAPHEVARRDGGWKGAQYVTWVRDPLSMLVSGVCYHIDEWNLKNRTLPFVINEVVKAVRNPANMIRVGGAQEKRKNRKGDGDDADGNGNGNEDEVRVYSMF